MNSALAAAARTFAAVVSLTVTSALTAHADTPGAQPPPMKEVQLTETAFSVGATLPSWVEQTPLPAADKSQPIVVRLADSQFLAGDAPEFFSRIAVQVNDTASLTSAGHISLPFVPPHQRLRLHSVIVHRGGEKLDRTSSTNVRFLQRESGLENGVYSGVVTASLLVADLRLGDTLDYAFSITGTNPAFGTKYMDSAYWDRLHPVLLRRVILNHPADRKISWRFVTDSKETIAPPKESENGAMKRLEFSGEKIPAAVFEPMTPPDYVAFRWIEFSEFTSWQEVAKWAAELFQRTKSEDKEFDKIVESIRAKPNDEERAVAALEFVQSEIRYFSVSLGESSHRPAQPGEVLQRRYGDCKDKSLFLVALLDRLGIAAKPALLSLGRRKNLDKSLPGHLSFDHAIVQVTVGNKDYFLDPTRLGQHGRLDRMGQAHEGLQALVIAPETTGLVTITSPKPSENGRSELVETATLPKIDAEAQLKIRQVWTGVTAEAMRIGYEQTPRDRFTSLFANALEQRFPGAKLNGEVAVEDERTNNIFILSASYTIPKLAVEQAGNWLVRLDPGNLRGAVAQLPARNRTAPLLAPVYPYKASYTFNLNLPESLDVWANPISADVQSKHFTFSSSTRYRGNIIQSVTHFEARTDRIEPPDFKKFSEDLRSLDKMPIGAIVIPARLLKVARSKPKKDLAKSIETQWREKISNATKAIESGRLSGNDLAAAYCTRATSYSDLAEFDAAIKDANESVKAAAGVPDYTTCRSSVYFGAGEFDKSIADLSAALSLGAPAGSIYQERGIRRFYAGQLNEAAEDFAKASDLLHAEDQVYADLWLTWTTQRLGKPLPDDLVARVAIAANGEWPRPALEMLHGKKTPEDVIKALNIKKGDDLQAASAEGYFYIGQHHMNKGDKDKAREFFAKTRATKVIHYTEYIAAGFELRALGAHELQTTAATPAVPAADAASAKPKPAAKTIRAKSKTKDDPEWNRRPFQ